MLLTRAPMLKFIIERVSCLIRPPSEMQIINGASYMTDALCEKEKIKITTHDDHYAKMMEKRSF